MSSPPQGFGKGKKQTPWLSDIDADGFDLDNVSIITSNATNPATTGAIRLGNTERVTFRNFENDQNLWIELNSSNQFRFNIENNHVAQGIQIFNNFGEIVIDNATAMASAFAPEIAGRAFGGSALAGMLVQGQIDSAQDVGTVTPAIKLVGRRSDISPIITRPIFSVLNHNTLLLEIDVDGNLKMQGNELRLDTDQSIVPSATGLTHNVPTDDIHEFDVNDIPILSISNDGIKINTGLVARSGTTGITASTTQTQGQAPLTTEINEVATVANTNDVVTLPSAIPFTEITILNNGANSLQIFPASGDDLGNGVDASTTLSGGSNIRFVAIDSINWELV